MLKISSKQKIAPAVQKELKQKNIDALIGKFIKEFSEGEIFLVGGVLRDILIGRKKRNDFDFVVRGVQPTKLKLFLQKYGTVSLVGKNFGVFKFRPKNFKESKFIDFALPRTEHALGSGGYRDFDVQSNANLPIEKDLSRRDFTINALAWDLKNKKLIDLFGGLNDLRGGIIRTVGDPKERFFEDYSRILRALRFAAELNFEIENRTWRAIKKLMPAINKKKAAKFIVPRETVAKEFLKSFYADPLDSFERWDQAGAFERLIPEITTLKICPQPFEYHAEGNAWKHIHLALKVLVSEKFKKEFNIGHPPLYVSLGVLFHDIAKPKTVTRRSKKHAHISFPGHAALGAKMAKKIVKRLCLESFKAPGIDIEAKKLGWLVEQHMFILGNDPKSVPLTTIEEYFMKENFPRDFLLQICYCDIRGSKMGSSIANVYEINYFGYKERIRKLRKRFPKGLPEKLLDGREIQEILKIKPGPKIAQLLKDIREEQLQGNIETKKEAKKFLKNKMLRRFRSK